jgi:tetratricopeptide repeat protein 21B
LQELNKG